jgi:hypothetical protein
VSQTDYEEQAFASRKQSSTAIGHDSMGPKGAGGCLVCGGNLTF